MTEDGMAAQKHLTLHERWAHFRFSVVGPLLAAPPSHGELQCELERLAAKMWCHPITGAPTHFGVSTIQRWYYEAKNATTDPVSVLRKKIRKDSGQQWAIGQPLREAIAQQYQAHPGWSYQLHHDNLRVVVSKAPQLGSLPQYATVRRYMKATGLLKRRRPSNRDTEGARRAEERLATREVRSYEASHVNGLWHLDFHVGSRGVLTPSGEWVKPLLLGIIDDRSRLLCHAQWYLGEESAELLIHGLSQAIQKRGLPRALMTDNGSAMRAEETRQGLARLGISHELTLEYSPYQNGKQESFWGQEEGRLLPMLEGCPELVLPLLNEAQQAWGELEYNCKVHSEIGQTPLSRYLAGPDLRRDSPSSDVLRLAFMVEERRQLRRSDGTVSVEGLRFEVPNRYRHFERVVVRYARWDLTHVFLVDEHTSTTLCRILPLDRTRNADGQRRSLEPATVLPPPVSPGIAPLLEQLMAQAKATGLPPAYLPKDDSALQKEELRD
jgi:transposase InsO family protein